MTLDVRDCTLSDLLREDKPFSMARYQRHYEWTLSEMEQLLSDLAGAFDEAKEKSQSAAFYFLGSVVLLDGSQTYTQIVDGQQRLTSLSMLLAAARDLIADKEAKSFIAPFLTIPANPLNGAPQRQRLQLHRGDNDFFETHFIRSGGTGKLQGIERQDDDSSERMRRNGLRAAEWLSEMPANDRGPFVHFVTDRCRLVVIRVTDEEDAFRIFETTNNRGRPISNVDVLRYALVEFATEDPAKREALLAEWDHLESELGQDGMKDFIAQWRIQILHGRRSSRSMARDVINAFKAPADALAFLEKELAGDVQLYREIAEADVDVSDEELKLRIDKALISLGLVDFSDWKPIAHILISRHRQDPHRLAGYLDGLDRLAWYFYFRNDAKGVDRDRRQRFSQVVAHLSKSSVFSPEVCGFDLTPGEKGQMRDLLQERIDPKWAPLRSLLVRIEMALFNKNLRLQRDAISVEHVLPRNPRTKAWLQAYDNDRRIIRQYAEMLGNLCAVPPKINEMMDNRNYETKRKIMKKFGVTKDYATARDVDSETSWSKGVIERRSKWLLGVLCEEFDIHAASVR